MSEFNLPEFVNQFNTLKPYLIKGSLELVNNTKEEFEGPTTKIELLWSKKDLLPRYSQFQLSNVRNNQELVPVLTFAQYWMQLITDSVKKALVKEIGRTEVKLTKCETEWLEESEEGEAVLFTMVFQLKTRKLTDKEKEYLLY